MKSLPQRITSVEDQIEDESRAGISDERDRIAGLALAVLPLSTIKGMLGSIESHCPSMDKNESIALECISPLHRSQYEAAWGWAEKQPKALTAKHLECDKNRSKVSAGKMNPHHLNRCEQLLDEFDRLGITKFVPPE